MVVIVTVIVISLLCLLRESWSPASPGKKTPTLKLGKGHMERFANLWIDEHLTENGYMGLSENRVYSQL